MDGVVGSSPPPVEAAGAGVAEGLNRVGLGYGIAIAVGILVLVSTIMLASYVCVKLHGRSPGGGPEDPSALRRRRHLLLQHSLEEIIASQDHHNNPGGPAPPQGLDEATLESYPKVVYNQKKGPGDMMMESSGCCCCCSICLADYSDGEVLRVLPDCGHGFHVACIDSWLRLQASCPMCRSSPLPTPVSTPLSELIPLARNPLVNVRYTIQNIL